MPIAIEMFLAGVACGVELLALVKKSSEENIVRGRLGMTLSLFF